MADYVVIGGGSSGGVVAARLSEDPNTTVTLLEAGGPGNSKFVSIPGMFAGLIQDYKINKLNWRFRTAPQKKLNNRSLYHPRGKMLGGSSGMNGMVYIRGESGDYDRWSELGNEGWSYDEVLPYFRKAENNERGADDYHGDSGPLHVSNGDESFDFYSAFLASGEKLDYPKTADFNGANREGLGIYQFTTKNGERASVKFCYLDPIMDRKNLDIQVKATVRRIVMEDGRAVAVEYDQDGQTKRVEVGKEVIVSGGAFGSPQILMLSGIGPRDELEKHGITVQHELPGVGENLHDHPDVMFVFKSKKRTGISLGPLGTLKNLAAFYQYFTKRKGWLANPPTAAGGFLRSEPGKNNPDFQLHMVPLPYRNHAHDYMSMIKWGFTMIVNIGHPRSRGRLTLKDANPGSEPNIDLNLLDHVDDLKDMRNAFKVTQEILHGPPLKDKIAKPLYPKRYLDTDAEIDDFLRAEVNHAYHPVGTCKMGRDDMAVVDARLKVRGLANVRVADASIMPEIINGNTNATCIMIGEKAADMIKQDAAAT